MDTERIWAETAGDFRRILCLQDADPIPQAVKEKYLSYRYMKDVSGVGAVTVPEKILIAMIAGHEVKRSVKPEIKAEEPETKKPETPLKAGDKVKSVYKGSAVDGVFIEYCEDSGNCRVKIAGEKAKFKEVLVSETSKAE